MVKFVEDSDSDIDISIDLHDIEISHLPSKKKTNSLSEVDDISQRRYVRGVEDVQRFALIEESDNEGDLAEDLQVETGFPNKLTVAGTGEGSVSSKNVFASIQGSGDDLSTQILIVEDNTYSAYALMSVF